MKYIEYIQIYDKMYRDDNINRLYI